MKKFTDLIAEVLHDVNEVLPWYMEQRMQENPDLLIVDVREPAEYLSMHIINAINVPRGILETACEYNYEDTVPALVQAREKEIIVVCRSGNRSVLAVDTMQQMGYRKISSLKTGLRGWNDYELPLEDADGTAVNTDLADSFFTANLAPEQKAP